MSDEQKNEIEHPLACDCEQLKKEALEYKSGWQRAVADYQNLQKEMAARRSELVAMSELQILEEFIPVYDNFKMAFAHHPELKSSEDNNKQIKNWIDGIGHIMKQFGYILKAHNVEEIKTVGEKFNPEHHEAAGEEESKEKPGIIIRELSGGYTMKGRVIKVARVVMAK